MKNLHEGHRERMRVEYRRRGLPMEAHKQLEMLLFYIRPQIDTNKIAHRLINEFDSLQGVLDADIRELMDIEGVGKSTAEFLHFIGDIAGAYGEDPPAKSSTPLDTPERMASFMRDRLMGQKTECILAAYLDAKGRLIRERLARDTADSAARVENSLRVTVALALRYNSANVLIGHNHPKGNPMPSTQDVAEARRIKDTLRAVGIGLSDFIIIGEDGETYSFIRGGLLF